MTLFFDTNALIDHALVRQTGQPMEIAYIIFWAENEKVRILISSGSFYTFAYVLQKNGVRREELRNKLKEYLKLITVADTNNEVLLKGLDSSFTDLEDSLQYMTAVKAKCDYLITSNVTDFKANKKDKILPITPGDFVTKVLGKKKGIDY
ncbi:PIN domain-containing protein [Dyadobacter diqingensis]|uniref:PIN domain-containing protein n=1 Tax=Dyadobacter diqingensis TaxID=2938121 RepID=UPI0020C56619|nr:PIN domain-containing protein [Dyadobacter diqingensis]